ncbi:Kynurenine/alpha-aminoadipate aminotransferase mitochondrial [Camponotus floridanus]|uniref:Kynurenine/alpha-aminoadipate aminotransferase mitochondrial n=1 Tax=Camponotus floridanus TaxID=104421 RepID=E2A2C0_CAMFO|nr:Kynurenine/alpha-aminoadipate aminotransferase mitochondrial [Camponotus floridanus]
MDYTKFYSKVTNKRRSNLIRHLSLAEWYVPQGGFFLWVKLISIDNVIDLVMKKCVPQGVVVVPGNAFYYDPSKPSKYLRLSYSYASPKEIDKVNCEFILILYVYIHMYTCTYIYKSYIHIFIHIEKCIRIIELNKIFDTAIFSITFQGLSIIAKIIREEVAKKNNIEGACCM